MSWTRQQIYFRCLKGTFDLTCVFWCLVNIIWLPVVNEQLATVQWYIFIPGGQILCTLLMVIFKNVSNTIIFWLYIYC